MGYTHSYSALRAFADQEWAAISSRVVTLISQLPDRVITAGGYYRDEPLRVTYEQDIPLGPQVDAACIHFNGCGNPAIVARPQLPALQDLRFPADDASVTWWPQFCQANQVTEHTDPADLGHETFLLEKTPQRDPLWDDPNRPFGYRGTKTARKPYDLLVCAALIVCQAVAPGALAISSDGDVTDWWPALSFVRAAFPDDRFDYQVPPGV